MRNEQNAVLASLTRAQKFLDEHNDVLSAVNASTRKQLDDVANQLATLSIAQEGGARGSKGETSRQRSLRVALRRSYMSPIAELAKLKLRAEPDFAALMLPPANSTPQRTVAAAHAMADAASLHAQIFIDNGLPSTFAEDLRVAADAVTESTTGRSVHQGHRSGATAGLIAEEKRGRTTLRVLNALILARVGSDDKLMAEWTVAKAVRRKPGPVAGTVASDSTPVTKPVVVTPTPAPTPITASIPATLPVGVAA
jgi:hypothetical protein